MKNNKTITVFDNGGKTQDQYTIIRSDGETWAASENPFHPCGIGMCNGNIGDDYYRKTIGAMWDNQYNVAQIARMVRSETKRQIELARADQNWLGAEVKDHTTLPVDVQKYILQILND